VISNRAATDTNKRHCVRNRTRLFMLLARARRSQFSCNCLVCLPSICIFYKAPTALDHANVRHTILPNGRKYSTTQNLYLNCLNLQTSHRTWALYSLVPYRRILRKKVSHHKDICILCNVLIFGTGRGFFCNRKSNEQFRSDFQVRQNYAGHTATTDSGENIFTVNPRHFSGPNGFTVSETKFPTR
jgi:hypothetical protein